MLIKINKQPQLTSFNFLFSAQETLENCKSFSPFYGMVLLVVNMHMVSKKKKLAVKTVNFSTRPSVIHFLVYVFGWWWSGGEKYKV